MSVLLHGVLKLSRQFCDRKAPFWDNGFRL